MEEMIEELEANFDNNLKIKAIFAKYKCKNCIYQKRCDQHTEIWEEDIKDGVNQMPLEFCSAIKLKQ